jgi:hypothetical protein
MLVQGKARWPQGRGCRVRRVVKGSRFKNTRLASSPFREGFLEVFENKSRCCIRCLRDLI